MYLLIKSYLSSETGVRYNIAFIKKGTTDTCVSQLIVGGLTYIDHFSLLYRCRNYSTRCCRNGKGRYNQSGR